MSSLHAPPDDKDLIDARDVPNDKESSNMQQVDGVSFPAKHFNLDAF
jgi:hypothetical protein